MVFIFGTLLTLFSLYAYALVDPNLTLISHPLWTDFRNAMVQFGYYQRENSSITYIALVIGLFGFSYFATKKFKQINVVAFAGIAALISIISYPFISHDFFNYLFDARILTFYHQNPYLHKALDFPNDPWIRFMHWTIRTYPYGPTFLPITLIPSFLSFGKFLLAFMFFKGLFAGFYFLAVYYLNKIDKKLAVFFATQPLIIVEGLINSHNDLLAVSFGIIGMYYLLNKAKKGAGVMFILSAGIKYMTAPLLLLLAPRSPVKPKAKWDVVGSFLLTLALILYVSFTGEIQPWYFLNLFIFLPYFKDLLMNSSIFFTGLLFAYYPFVRFGQWTKETVAMKHQIIFAFLVINIVYILYIQRDKLVKIVRKR